MKKTLLKVGTWILCALLCLGGAFPALAATWVELGEGDSKAGQIHVTVDTDEVVSGMRATAFRIIKVNVAKITEGEGSPSFQPAEPVYTWAPGVVDWVKENGSDYIDADGAVTEAYINYFKQKDKPSEDPTFIEFIDKLSAAIANGDTKFKKNEDGFFDSADPLAVSNQFGGSKDTTISGLSKGSYIVLIEGGQKIYQPSIANLTPVWQTTDTEGVDKDGWYVDSPVSVNIKAADVSIVKTVSDTGASGSYGPAASAGIADTVYFNIRADVPKYPKNALAKTFVISDTVSDGLAVPSTLKVFGIKGDGSANQELTANTDYTLTIDQESRIFTVTFTDKYERVADYKQVEITYNTTVTAQAVTGKTGNPNTAYLDYANDPYNTESKNTINSKAIVYTYGLNLTKTTDNKITPLPGAVFVLEKKTGDAWSEKPVQNNLVRFVMDESGSYHRVLSGTDASTSVISGTEGKLLLKGLDTGEYRLQEIKAPEGGYVVLKDYVYFTITDTVDGDKKNTPDGILDKESANLEDTSAVNGLIAYTIPNSKGFDLPLTGGMGTLLFTAGGIVLVVGAVVLLLVANRKKSRRS